MNKIDILDAVNITNNRVKPFEGEKRYLATGDLSDQGIDNFAFVDYENKPSRADLMVDEGDLIIARMKATNKVFLTGQDTDDLIVSTGFLTLKPKNGFMGRYLYHYFRSNSFQRLKDRLCSGATQKAINNSSFKKLEVPYCLPKNQKKIIQILDTADTLLQKRKEQLNHFDDYLKSVFLEMFGDPVRNKKEWKIKSLSSLAEFVSGGTPSKQKEHYWIGDYPWISPKDMKHKYIYDSLDHISAEAIKETTLKKIPVDSILIVVRGLILVRYVPIALTKKKLTINQDLKALIINNALIKPIFLLFTLLVSNHFLLKKVLTASHGTKRFETSTLEKLNIIVPPFHLQNKFASIVEQVEQTKQKMCASLDEMDNHFNALMQRYFG